MQGNKEDRKKRCPEERGFSGMRSPKHLWGAEHQGYSSRNQFPPNHCIRGSGPNTCLTPYTHTLGVQVGDREVGAPHLDLQLISESIQIYCVCLSLLACSPLPQGRCTGAGVACVCVCVCMRVHRHTDFWVIVAEGWKGEKLGGT